MLLETHPQLTAEWADARDASEFSPGSKYRADWRCKLGHRWNAPIYSRARGAGCPFCTNRKVLVGFNDLPSTHPELAAEWADSRDVQTVTAGSNYVAQWECTNGHLFTAPVLRRAKRGSGCNACLNRTVIRDVNSIGAVHPELVSEWADESDVFSVHVGSKYAAQWKCPEGHKYTRAVRARAAGDGCQVCTGRQVLAGVNDLATTHPALLSEYVDERDPSTLSAGSEYPARWQCAKGHTWTAYVYRRTGKNPTGCPECSAKTFVSKVENEVAAYVSRVYSGQLERNVRREVSPHELDIWLPELRVAIEVNGVYFHSDAFKGRDYHAQKAAACRDSGIQLIQVWEDDWVDRRPIVERMLSHKLGVSVEPRIAARSTIARTATADEARAFLEANHIQGFTGATYHLALEADGKPVAMMSLKRTGKPGELCLERYATAAHVLGGQSKLIRYAEKALPNWSNLITFADYEVSDGTLYERTGWVKDAELAPDYRYLVSGKRVHKFNYRVKRFRDDPSLEFHDGMTERELAGLNGLLRVWDSGKLRYHYIRPLHRGGCSQ